MTYIGILPASTLRNITSLQPVKINALRKSRALIGCCHIRKTPPAVTLGISAVFAVCAQNEFQKKRTPRAT
jgi:hypothetical protein